MPPAPSKASQRPEGEKAAWYAGPSSVRWPPSSSHSTAPSTQCTMAPRTLAVKKGTSGACDGETTPSPAATSAGGALDVQAGSNGAGTTSSSPSLPELDAAPSSSGWTVDEQPAVARR